MLARRRSYGQLFRVTTASLPLPPPMGSLTSQCVPSGPEGAELLDPDAPSGTRLPRQAAVAQRLREVYEAKFAFPSWSCERLGEGSLEVYAQSVTVYYPQGAQLAEVKRLVREREPVNIGMKRRYDQQKMQEYFGYATGAYGRLSSSERLGPNLAVYCRTPMRAPDGRERDVHVINVIGFAFDKTQQPDYQYFLNHDDEDGRRAELVKKMSQMWEYIYFCAHEKKLKCVRLSQVGGGAFSLLLGGNFDYQALRKESLEPVMARYPEIETKELQFIPDWEAWMKKEGFAVQSALKRSQPRAGSEVSSPEDAAGSRPVFSLRMIWSCLLGPMPSSSVRLGPKEPGCSSLPRSSRRRASGAARAACW
ncbi:unnamed protein product [Durusdinium trenchii]|uniref:Decapping nuclease n=1 Tax=Durusdinium trenchii TaxID=1381693 RepID=A0ABP0JFW2_9DINO